MLSQLFLLSRCLSVIVKAIKFCEVIHNARLKKDLSRK